MNIGENIETKWRKSSLSLLSQWFEESSSADASYTSYVSNHQAHIGLTQTKSIIYLHASIWCMHIFVNNLSNDYFTQTVFMYLTLSTYNKYAADDIETKIGKTIKMKV